MSLMDMHPGGAGNLILCCIAPSHACPFPCPNWMACCLSFPEFCHVHQPSCGAHQRIHNTVRLPLAGSCLDAHDSQRVLYPFSWEVVNAAPSLLWPLQVEQWYGWAQSTAAPSDRLAFLLHALLTSGSAVCYSCKHLMQPMLPLSGVASSMSACSPPKAINPIFLWPCRWNNGCTHSARQSAQRASSTSYTLSGGLPQMRGTHVYPCSLVSAANCKCTRPLLTHLRNGWTQTKRWENKQHLGTSFATSLLCLSQSAVNLSGGRAKEADAGGAIVSAMIDLPLYRLRMADCICRWLLTAD